jgi:hypothetical protein
LIGIIDGNFVNICQPKGLGNFRANKDLQQYNYSGKEKARGLKFLAVIFPNGMICLYCPDYGSTHDGSLWSESGWIQFLARFERRETGLRFAFLETLRSLVATQHAERNSDQDEAHVQQYRVAHSNCC